MLFCLFFRFFVPWIKVFKPLNFRAEMTIILIGYMGSGKSVVGKKLSDVLGYDFIDFDDYIQKKEGKTIKEIFNGRGELYFRKMESKYVQEVLSNPNTVISLGGGTPCYGNNMNLIRSIKNASSVYLKTSVLVLSKRLFPERNQRPLISQIENKEKLTEFIAKHLFERTPYYTKSDITVNTDDKTIDEIVETIVMKLF